MSSNAKLNLAVSSSCQCGKRESCLYKTADEGVSAGLSKQSNNCFCSSSFCVRIWELLPVNNLQLRERAKTQCTTELCADANSLKSGPLSLSRLIFIHIGAAITLFLATTDATIVSTSLPTIVADLHGSQTQYAWVGIAYLLTQTAFQPLFSRFSDLLGRKNVLFFSLTLFMVGSLLCGLSQSMLWLCIFRALSGIGGGGIVNSVWVITSEAVEECHRAKWSQALSVTWSASAVAGPLLGGFFSNQNNTHVNWRWAFFMNLLIGFVAFVILIMSLQNISLSPCASRPSWRQQLQKFDFLGLVAFMSGTIGVILGLSFSSASGWMAPSTLVPLILGCMAFILGSVYELCTKREPLFPPILFKDRTVGIILILSFLHNFAFNAGTFYLSLYYQAVNGSTALQAGLRMLPYSLGSALASVPAALFISSKHLNLEHSNRQKLVISLGLAISTLGFGLQIMLNQNSPVIAQELFPLISGIGIGMLFHAPYQILTRAADAVNLASVTGAFFLVRFTGATTGLSVAALVFDSHLVSCGVAKDAFSSSISLLGLSHANSDSLLMVLSDAIRLIWVVCTPCLGLCFLLSYFIKIKSINSTIGGADTITCDPAPPMSTEAKLTPLTQHTSGRHALPFIDSV